MCGRFAMNKDTDDLIREFVAEGGKPDEWWKEWAGSYSIAPTQHAPIVRDTGSGRFLELPRWDWMKSEYRPSGPPTINARIEKLVSGSWAGAFTAARCVVPMTGYFEWTGEKGDKTPHFLHGDGTLAAAGLTWSMDVKGVDTRCFVVITRDARDAGGQVHNRMPAFLTPDAMEAWLEPVKLDRGGREEIHAMLDASSSAVASTIRHHVVNRKVNNSRTVDPTDPTVIEPLE